MKIDHFLCSCWRFAVTLHRITDVGVRIWWSFVVWFPRIQYKVFAELSHFTCSIVRFTRSPIARLIPYIDRLITIHVQLLSIGTIFRPIKRMLKMSTHKKTINIQLDENINLFREKVVKMKTNDFNFKIEKLNIYHLFHQAKSNRLDVVIANERVSRQIVLSCVRMDSDSCQTSKTREHPLDTFFSCCARNVSDKHLQHIIFRRWSIAMACIGGCRKVKQD